MTYLAVAAAQGRSTAGWDWLPLRRVVKIRREVNTTRSEPLLALSAERGVEARPDDGGRQWASEATEVTYWVVQPGDLVFNPMWALEGGVAVSGLRGAVSPAYRVYELREDVHGRFLHHFVRSALALEQYRALVRGVTTFDRSVTRDDLEAMPVPVPPLSEQRAIADLLDTETARIDALIAKKCRMVDLLEERHLARIFRAVTGTDRAGARRASGVDWIGEVPAHWGVPWLGAHYTTQLGKMLNAEAAAGPEQYPYVRNTNVQWDRIDLGDLATMHFGPEDRARCELRTGDLLVCEGGEVGRAAVWPGEPENVYFQKAIHRVRPLGRGDTRFLMYCLRAAAWLNVFAVEGNQSTIVHLTGEKLREHRFPFPPLEEQAGIVEELDAHRDKTHGTRDRLSHQITLLQEHRQALITAAVTGELEVPGVAA